MVHLEPRERVWWLQMSFSSARESCPKSLRYGFEELLRGRRKKRKREGREGRKGEMDRRGKKKTPRYKVLVTSFSLAIKRFAARLLTTRKLVA